MIDGVAARTVSCKRRDVIFIVANGNHLIACPALALGEAKQPEAPGRFPCKMFRL
ncbi:hypothetical protein SJ05684_b52500 (plasmid) [Sinorhizobium sojae CCBAU 05684]|uniref:Uncharacterized protein n=1 Tax=Sinorhizobium sojae CCBAU 05684 TaxID=716928 RepID=A0A249PKG2_9HYPH|nr:hypothetical protein SJ05684_b52500 [Sinorhizobium sojae CCBAU 05684]